MTDKKIETFSNNRKRLFSEAEAKGFDRIFFTQIIEENFRFYDGVVRSSIFSAAQYPIIFVVAWIIPQLSSVYLDTVVRSFVYVILFAFLVIYFTISPDINSQYKKLIEKIR